MLASRTYVRSQKFVNNERVLIFNNKISVKQSSGTHGPALSSMRGPLSYHIIVHLARINDRASSVYKEAKKVIRALTPCHHPDEEARARRKQRNWIRIAAGKPWRAQDSKEKVWCQESVLLRHPDTGETRILFSLSRPRGMRKKNPNSEGTVYRN